jgi:neutral ceramidase
VSTWQSAESAVPKLFLGTSGRVITPAVGCDLSGFIARTEPMAGVHDDLCAKAMVWAEDASLANAAALVTLDLIEIEEAEVATIRAGIESMTDIPGERIGVTCTHTHGGPATMPGRRLGRVDASYLKRLCQAAAEVTAEAARSIEPVVMRWAIGSEPTVGKNRRVPDGVIDPDIPVVRFQREDGTVVALLMSYSCHPVTLGPDNLQATADYPGYVCRAVEAVYPEARAHFVTGCCGQVNNGHKALDGEKGHGMHWRTYGEAQRIGRALAGAAIQAAEQSARLDVAVPTMAVSTVPVCIRTARRTIQLPFLPPPERSELELLLLGWRNKAYELQQRDRRPGELEQLQVFIEWANGLLSGEPGVSIGAEIMAIVIGDVSLVLLPGESFVEFGIEIKQRSVPRSVMTLAYANGRPGYIPHRSAYPAGGYEVDEAFRYYGYPSCFAPEAGDLIVETALELLAELEPTGCSRSTSALEASS